MSISPQQIIADQQAKIAHLRAALAEAEATLKGMEAIYSAVPVARRRPTTTGSELRTTESSAGGRQPGAISQRWRVILNELYNRPEGFSAQDAVDLVLKLEGRVMKPSEARRLLEGYEEHGYVAQNPAGRFFVTQVAARKFNFVKAAPDVVGSRTHNNDSIEPTNASTAIGQATATVVQAWPSGQTTGLADFNEIFESSFPKRATAADWSSRSATPPIHAGGGNDLKK